MWIALVSGFLTGLSLIVAIGAQNAFVLRQGIRGEHVAIVVAICALSDALLIAAGVGGFGRLLRLVPWLADAMRWAGAAFSSTGHCASAPPGAVGQRCCRQRRARCPPRRSSPPA